MKAGSGVLKSAWYLAGVEPYMAEHGRAFTNAAGGGNDCCSGFITPSFVARPETASTSAAIASGTVGVDRRRLERLPALGELVQRRRERRLGAAAASPVAR